jgi:Trypsin-like peptidase domain
VKLPNGAFFPVSGVLASDSDRDLAIVRVNGKNLPFLTLGDIGKVHVGDHVVAVGSPLGFEGTVSDGIVSAVRDVDGRKWIQTTAPVSHGNSGGPLLDMSNHVVGVITRGVNPAVGQNLNFAVPCDAVAELRLIAQQQQTKSLEAVTNRDEASPTEDVVWTSLMTGRDFKLRQDGDYLYIDRIDVPPAARAAGRFARSELKKDPDGKWRGKTHEHEYCSYSGGGTNVCNFDTDIEIDFMSDRRIEGTRTTWTKFDCKRCQSKLVEHVRFTWIPK